MLCIKEEQFRGPVELISIEPVERREGSEMLCGM
jgi:hypothetical protein